MKTCENCGAVFQCSAGSGPCWCFDLPVVEGIPDKFKDCLCERCLGAFSNESKDYYINEEGLMVFTEAFHLKRGSCCGNNCLHCPYPKN